jgi:D-alanyl-D-alanine carboxypeptidase/D-alanyl-D-alanine-endopeptidase (penicillin-binding protein 4)
MTRPVGALLLAALAACASGGRSARTEAAGPPPSTRAALRAFVDSLVEAPEFRNAHWGVLVVDAERGDTLYSRNAGKLFLPASNQKIITGAVALELLGPAYRFRTTFARRGAMRGDTLVGDLVVVGRGDPTVSDHMRVDAMIPLREAADSLRARGVRVIAGRVVAAGDAVPDAPLGYGWAWDDLDSPYAAGVDELLFNEGFSLVHVQGGRAVGGAVSARTSPAPGVPSVVVAAATSLDTLALPGGRGLTVAADPDRPSSAVLRGQIRPADTATVEIAHRSPSTAYISALTQALTQRGVVALGRLTAAAADSTRADTLFTLLSPPLAEVMPALEKPSQNQIAEVLYKTLGLERTGVGSADSGRAVVERQLRAWGADSTGFVVRDGSGLSRHDYVSPETIVRVLDAARRASYFELFYDALPVAGVDGTIANRMRGTPAQGNAHAKTGYVDRARSLSGYVTTADGRMLVFSMLANNWTTPVRAVERVQDAVVARLAGTRLGVAPAPTVGGR